jgi:hypothetical protein
MRRSILFAFLLAASLPALAQTSASFRLDEHVFNAGGDPHQGQVLTSASFRITLDAIGEGLVRTGLSSPSFRTDAGFIGAYPPPGEVTALSFLDDDTLEWSPEASVGSYNLYRDPLAALAGLNYGQCLEPRIDGETATDTDVPTPGGGFFYLVTARNRLDEEGVKGWDSAGLVRSNSAPCP